MWWRIVEILLGLWLLSSPLVFGQAGSGLVNDVVCALAVIVLASVSLVKRSSRAHFFILLVAAWLFGVGYFAGYPSPPEAQNRVIIGILLAMFAIIPTRIGEMPDSWQRLYAEKAANKEHL